MNSENRAVVRQMDEVLSRALDHGDRPAGWQKAVTGNPPLTSAVGLRVAIADALTRFPRVKSGVRRGLHLYRRRRAVYTRVVTAPLYEMRESIEGIQTELDQRLDSIQAAQASVEATLQGTDDVVNEMRQHLAALGTSLAELQNRHVADRTDVIAQRSLLNTFLLEARRRLPEPFDADQLNMLSAQLERGVDALYVELEDAFRGTRAEILEQQRVYLSDVLRLDMPGCPVVDVGCGRGEWLELLRDNDVLAYGVDINEQAVETNKQRGLDVRHEDAIAHFAALPEGSVAAVTGFHLIEHLEFDTLVTLVDAVLRALRPGGVMIFETPNPTNVTVGAAAFFIDPTHRRPIHPDFARFLVLARGFFDVDIRFLHPKEEYGHLRASDLPETTYPQFQQALDQISWALFGPQDYAVVGRKAAPST